MAAALAGEADLFEARDPEVESVVEKVRSRRRVHEATDDDVIAVRMAEVTVVLPAQNGSVLRIRKASTPEREQRRLYAALGLPSEIITPRRTWFHPHQT